MEAARLPAALAGVPTGFLLGGLLGSGAFTAGFALRSAGAAALLGSGFTQAARHQTRQHIPEATALLFTLSNVVRKTSLHTGRQQGCETLLLKSRKFLHLSISVCQRRVARL